MDSVHVVLNPMKPILVTIYLHGLRELFRELQPNEEQRLSSSQIFSHKIAEFALQDKQISFPMGIVLWMHLSQNYHYYMEHNILYIGNLNF